MFLSIIIFIVSIIPAVLVFILLKKRKSDDAMYKKSCNSALIRGLVSVLPILAVSATLHLLNNLIRVTLLRDMNILIYRALYTFIVLAFAEEIVKYGVFKLLLRKKYYAYTWADVTAFMVIVGTGFGLIEDIPYAIGASPIVMLIRGFTMGHVGYGFIMGWFYGKRLFTGKKRYGVIAFLLPFLIHGLYDFSLSEELIALNDDLAFIGISLAVLDIVLLILLIRFFVRSAKKERYNTPIITIDEVQVS